MLDSGCPPIPGTDAALLCGYGTPLECVTALILLHGVRGAYSDLGEVLSDAVSVVGEISEGNGDEGLAELNAVEIDGIGC